MNVGHLAKFNITYKVVWNVVLKLNQFSVVFRPALEYIYMLEFHPSLAMIGRIPEALNHIFKVGN